ncbi:MAG: diphosphomevalonate decarboxylase [Bacteroidota bacterium]
MTPEFLPFLPFKDAKPVGTLPMRLEASWQSPSNIALIKYWGKRPGQFPVNPSISLTLRNALTKTTVSAEQSTPSNPVLVVNGDATHPFIPKLDQLLRILMNEVPFLASYRFQVTTNNTFPHSTGIASSASGISAFVLCILDIALQISRTKMDPNEWNRIASFASRLGSGSACRSIFGGFSVWGECGFIEGSSDEYAIPVNSQIHLSFLNLKDAILIVSRDPKQVSSSVGHFLMKSHPFAESRRLQAISNLQEIMNALGSGDFDQVGRISETEALSLHSLIMTSEGNPILMAPETIRVIKKIQAERKRGTPLFYTLDAGPNVHILYPEADSEKVNDFITNELLPVCLNAEVIFDECGEGPGEV